nr:putative methionine--trna ligase, mitochondrial [Quercus suber]
MDSADKRTWTEYASLQTLPARVDAQMKALHPNKAAEVIIHRIHNTNSFITALSPWLLVTKLRSAMADTTGQEMYEAEKAGQSIEQMELEIERTIYLSAETLRLSGIMLQPFMPAAAKRLLDMLGVAMDRRTWEWCSEGRDDSYGTPMVPLGKGDQGSLFPPLVSEF